MFIRSLIAHTRERISVGGAWIYFTLIGVVVVDAETTGPWWSAAWCAFMVVGGITAFCAYHHQQGKRTGKAILEAQLIHDGFGNTWVKHHSLCDMHVVRPGKAQCNCPDSDCYEPDDWPRRWGP